MEIWQYFPRGSVREMAGAAKTEGFIFFSVRLVSSSHLPPK